METDKTNQKVMMLSFVIAGLLSLLVSRVLFDTLGGVFAVVERWRSIEAVKHGLPLAIAAAVFLSLQLNPKVKVWADEVISEIRKIVWPSQRDTTITTVAVCVMVVVAGLGLSVVDYVSSVLIKWIVN
ncbi:MAG: preprotein translocase subunit SecE [Bdellovibrionales bacterium]